MTTDEIQSKMHELEEIINYKFKNVELLKKAMCAQKNGDEHANEILATMGDAILGCLVKENFFKKDNNLSKGALTDQVKKYLNNNNHHNLLKKLNILDYAHHNRAFYPVAPKNDLVWCPKHTPYIESIVYAIYQDGGIRKTRKWVHSWFIPKIDDCGV